MSKQGDDFPGHGEYHRARPELEREIWPLVRDLGVVEKGDEVLRLVVENVYTRYDSNFLNGTLFHWPYLCSERAIALCDKALRDYPKSDQGERLLWLKAFALRCPPVPPEDRSEQELDTYRSQAAWACEEERARAIYREIAKIGRSHAKRAKELAEEVSLSLILPVSPLQPDPRALP